MSTAKTVSFERKRKGPTEGGPRNARIILPPADYERMRVASSRYCISMQSYIKQAVMMRIVEDEARAASVASGPVESRA